MTVCVTSYVFGTYKRFIPFFCYSVARSYPDYHVKIFVDDELEDADRASIADIQRNVSRRVTVVEHALSGIPVPEKPVLRGGQKKLLRWMFEQADFEGFDCVYFSDIDFLVLAQEPRLADFHKENARSLGLPFSNMVRTDKENTGQGSRRLTGLHFVLSDEYFPLVDPVVRDFKRDPSLIAKEIPHATSDEHVLFQTVRNAIPFDSKAMCRKPRPVPGIHLAWSRNPKLLARRTKRLLTPYRGAIPYFTDVHGQLRSFCEDPVFLRMLWQQKVPEVVMILAYMGISPSGSIERGKFAALLLKEKSRVWARMVRYKLSPGLFTRGG